MKKSINYYVGGRNPHKGGLVIWETNQDFPNEYKERISNETLELVSHSDEMLPLAIFPVDYTNASVAMALKIKESKVEKRPHEVIRGITVSDIELKELCCSLAEDKIEEFFFPFKGDKLEELDEWKPESEPTCGNQLELFWKSMDQAQVLGFFYAIMDVIRNRKKVQLIVPDGAERVVQAACYSVIPKSQACNLSTISCGECTVAAADILITKHIDFQDARKYQKMTLGEFIVTGTNICEKNEHKIRTTTIETMVEKCLSYISNYEMSDYELSEIRRTLLMRSAEDYRAFQIKLRIELDKLEICKKYVRRFLKVLYIAYEVSAEHRILDNSPVMSAPYDMEGILKFLEEYTRNKRQFRKYVMEVLILQNEYLFRFLSKNEIEKANKSTVKKIMNYFVNVNN